MDTSIVFDLDLIKRYDISGPRYTSYPTAVQFNESFDALHYQEIAKATNASARPLSLYFHIPFCATVCYYCACNKIITANRKRAHPYLNALHKEIEMQGALFDYSRPVTQLHWGGGTPTFINDDEMIQLMQQTRRYFQLKEDDTGEYSIEIDPREVSPEKIKLLRELGFNRMSFGVQDFDPLVQKAVNRIQTLNQTWSAVEAARNNGFRSINIDLIYGLPHQSVASFTRTVEQVLQMAPDRLSVFNYAHLPHMFKVQKQMDEDTLPSAQEKLDILKFIIDRLVKAGYIYIGMDHFAKPDDELAKAQQEGSLYRNFQGYSTQSECDLVAMGLTSIGMVGDSYSQNRKEMDEYTQAIDAGQIPVFRGVELTADDKLRREIITQLICHFHLDFSALEKQYAIQFEAYFSEELVALKRMVDDGLIELTSTQLLVKPAGRLLIRNICMVFDLYLRKSKQTGFSKVI